MISLALPGAWVSDGEPADPFASCVGGAPSLPAPAAALLKQQKLSCDVCHRLLSLIVQVHAPWPPSSRSPAGCQDRCLLLLGCTSPACGTSPGSWRAFRYQHGGGRPASSGSAVSATQSFHRQLRHQHQQPQQQQQQQLSVEALHPKVLSQSALGPTEGQHSKFAAGPRGDEGSAGDAKTANSSGLTPDLGFGAFGASKAFTCGPISGSGSHLGSAEATSWVGAGATPGGGDSTGGTFGGGSGTAVDSLSFDSLDAALSTAIAARAASQAASGYQSRRQKSKQRGKLQPMPPAAVQSMTLQSATMRSAPAGSHRGEPSHSTEAAASGNDAGLRGGESGADGTKAGKDLDIGPHVAAGDYSAGNSDGGGEGFDRAAGSDDAAFVDVGTPLPRFHLRWMPEPEAAVAALGEAEACHIAELLQRYQTDHEMVEADGEGWVDEGYEKGALRDGNAAFPKFTKRLARSPLQCLRYSPGGQALWPAAKGPTVANCPACGAPRAFEMQAMPALHQALAEGLSWHRHHLLQQDQQRRHRKPEPMLLSGSGAAEVAAAAPDVGPTIDAWAWSTIAVFTCSESCFGKACEGGGGGDHCFDGHFIVEEAVQTSND